VIGNLAVAELVAQLLVGRGAIAGELVDGAQTSHEGREAGAQVVVVVGALKVNGMAFGGMDGVAVDEFVGPPNARAPAVEGVLHASVVDGVWIVVEVVSRFSQQMLSSETGSAGTVAIGAGGTTPPGPEVSGLAA